MKELIKMESGDSFQKLHTLKPSSVDVILTDIPYTIISRPTNGLRKIDKGKTNDITIDVDVLCYLLYRVFRQSCYIFCGYEQLSTIIERFKGYGLTTRLCIWEKSNPSPMNGSHLWLSGIETCVFARKPKATFNEHCKNSVWKYPVARSKGHPTTKPLSLFKRIISASTNENDTVLDPFMGSGTTGVACVEMNRKFIGYEIDSTYFKNAKKRINDARKYKDKVNGS